MLLALLWCCFGGYFMNDKMTWKEIEGKYPNEWVLAIDYEMNNLGEVIQATIVAHSADKDEIYSHSVDANKVGIWFTGESQFRGLRSHAKNNAL